KPLWFWVEQVMHREQKEAEKRLKKALQANGTIQNTTDLPKEVLGPFDKIVSRYEAFLEESETLVTYLLNRGNHRQAWRVLEGEIGSRAFYTVLPYFLEKLGPQVPADELTRYMRICDRLVFSEAPKVTGYSLYRFQYLYLKGICLINRPEQEFVEQGAAILMALPSGEGNITFRDFQRRKTKASSVFEKLKSGYIDRPLDIIHDYRSLLIVPQIAKVGEMRMKGANALNLSKADTLIRMAKKFPGEREDFLRRAEAVLKQIPLTVEEGHLILQERQELLLECAEARAKQGKWEEAKRLLMEVEKETFAFIDQLAVAAEGKGQLPSEWARKGFRFDQKLK
ncbi:MAG: hypothetical protein Q7S00_05850, partial [bacterium]|nr:hypothetical protein [bacterium]